MRILNRQALASRIEQRAREDLLHHRVSGLSVIVRQEGEVVYRNHFGTVSPDSACPVSDDTLYRLASMTKPITAVAVMTLVDRGMLRLEDPVETYLPDFRNIPVVRLAEDGTAVADHAPTAPLTVRSLLTHTSGLANGKCGEYYYTRITPEDDRTLESFMRFWARAGLSFDPGTREEYCPTVSFDVLARIVEVITGERYPDYIRRAILAPCGMEDTTFTPTEDQWRRLITMHDRVDGVSRPHPMTPGCVFEVTPVTHWLGGAGLISSPDDYSRFAEMLLGGGRCAGGRILSEAAVAAIATPQVPAAIQPGHERWGLGVRVITGEPYTYLPVGTFGWSGAYGTHFWVDPVNRITAVYMKNSRYNGGSGAVTAANFEKDVCAALEG